MMWKIRIAGSAKDDIKEIKKWYKEQSLQAAENFIKELTASIESLKKEIAEYKPVHNNYKRLLLKKFPFTVYYQRKEKERLIEINAILHNRRDSDIITKRLYE